jgi:hypothetical protein
MNDEQLDNLFKTARGVTRDTARGEFGFETRLMARIRAEHAQKASWFAVAWKLMPVFAAIVMALGVWNVASVNSEPTDLASVITADTDESPVVSHLAGE